MSTKFSNNKNYKVYAVLVSGYFKDHYKQYFSYLEHRAAKEHCRFVYFSSSLDFYYDSVDEEGEKSIFDLVPIDKFDAIIMFTETFKDDLIQKSFIRGANIENVPVITIDKKLPGAAVHLNFEYGDIFRTICEHMIGEHDFKNIYYMSGIAGNPYSDQRESIFKEVMHKYGKPFNIKHVYYGQFWESPCLSALNKMLSDIEKGQEVPDCIICANDSMAITTIEFLQEHGYRVPEDIAVSGLDGIDCEKHLTPRLTTGVTDVELMIDKLFEVLALNISGDYSMDDIHIMSKFQLGCSCGCDGIKSISSGLEMLRLRGEMPAHLHYEMDCRQLVSNNGIGIMFDEAMDSVPKYLSSINYEDFYFICNEDFAKDTMTGTHSQYIDYADNLKFTNTMYVWDFNSTNPNYKGFNETIQYGEILPDFDKVLDSNKTILLLPIHSKGTALGYTAVTYDFDAFCPYEYATFSNNFMHMIGVQYDQIHLLKIYITDSLTGLYNRTGFSQRMESYMDLNSENEISIVSIDIEGLKAVNDSWGHEEGDNAIKEISTILSECAPESILSRIEGDQFLICTFGKDLRIKTEEMIHSINHKVEKRNQYTDKYYQLRIKIDYYTCDVSSHTLDYFLKKADDLIFSTQGMI
ncbi:MAG: GGDEF domain-containing protein [Lachnospiraceae bacterium]|nr:GGDEF domain-containing protein [Lachnospiraceae bacterium]